MPRPTLTEVDPFDLPDWLGAADVTWESEQGLQAGHHVAGRLTASAPDETLACDILAVDEAYPQPVVEEAVRSRSHQAWQHGQVLVGRYDDRLTLGVPGTHFDADRVIEAMGRLARAVGAPPDHFSVRLRIGEGRGPHAARPAD